MIERVTWTSTRRFIGTDETSVLCHIGRILAGTRHSGGVFQQKRDLITARRLHT
ncbi:uncharacterized protein METZ01_LOCUS180435 [marine metagenome]|uniref:Uncharacterized protein n=1 Tax=marine metagenome TaxID=408172 RepID=A0A382CPN3_9ZZZZ